jgi:Holliday junction resolvase RusA-like endonuclease
MISHIFSIETKLSPNFRHVGKGRSSYLPPDYSTFRLGATREMREQWGNHPPLTCPVTVRCFIPYKYRGDIVNYYKGLEDCLVTAGVLKDDSPDIVQRIEISRLSKLHGGYEIIALEWG